MSTIAGFVPLVSNAKAGIEGFFGVNPITGDKISGLEQGIALTAIVGGPLIKLGAKVGKGAINTGKEVVGQVKNILHPDKVKEAAKKVYDDYIKSPLQKGYTYFKNYTKKLGDVKTPLTYEAATPLGSIKVPKTVSEVTQDLKKATVQMAKKLDEKIGGKSTGKSTKNTTTLWDIKTTADKTLKYKFNGGIVTAYRDPKTGLWWAKDTTGYANSAFKVFKEAKGGKELHWVADSDKYGNYILDKHKSSTGTVIKIK